MFFDFIYFTDFLQNDHATTREEKKKRLGMFRIDQYVGVIGIFIFCKIEMERYNLLTFQPHRV